MTTRPSVPYKVLTGMALAARQHSRQKPRAFLWQAALILLPLLTLTAVGIHSLRQEGLRTRIEAAEQARIVADAWADALFRSLPQDAPGAGALIFHMDPRGALIHPRPLSPISPPPVIQPESPSDRALWALAWIPATNSQARTLALDACEDLLSRDPEAAWTPTLAFRRASLQAMSGDFPAALSNFAILHRTAQWRDARGQTGLPLVPLAVLKQLEALARIGTNKSADSKSSFPQDSLRIQIEAAAALADHMRRMPSENTGFLLEEAVRLERAIGQTNLIGQLLAEWQRHQTARQLYRDARSLHWESPATSALPLTQPELEQDLQRSLPNTLSVADGKEMWPDPQWSWFESAALPAGKLSESTNNSPELWLGMSRRTGTNREVVCLAMRQFSPAVAAIAQRLPRPASFLGIDILCAGRGVLTMDGAPGVLAEPVPGAPAAPLRVFRKTSAAQVLGSSRMGSDQTSPVTVRAVLLRPDLLYAAQRERTRWFGILIITSAFAAVMGLVATWRGLRRQQELAHLKDNFVSSVSHELRAPIAALRLMAENLQGGQVSDAAKQHVYFRMIEQECRRLSRLVSNMLDFARIEQGRKQYTFEPTDVRGLIDATVRLMTPPAREHGIELQLDPKDLSALPDDPLLDGDAVQQALINLIDNALKHSPKGQPVVVGARRVDTASLPELQLWVEDRGPGIPKEEQSKIFDLFYRLGSELRRETPGVGIGLSIVKHIVEAHGGRVEVDSEPGAGSRFTLVLPCRESTGDTLPHNAQ